MSASCPYCGAKLNLGLRFCVVCGRHVTTENMGKFSGLKGGFRPADITRRLDEIISVARFKKSRQSHHLHRAARWTVINTVYLVVATGLFYSAVVYSLELMFPGKFKDTQMPVEIVLGLFNQGKDNLPKPARDEGAVKAPAVAPDTKAKSEAKSKPKAASKKKSVKRSKKRSRKKRSRRKRRKRKT